jgi:hypothetical protein
MIMTEKTSHLYTAVMATYTISGVLLVGAVLLWG